MSITIQPASHDHITAITEIYGHYVLHTAISFEEKPPKKDEMQRRFSATIAAGLPYLVALDDDQVLGYAYASLYRPRRAYRFTVEESVYVHPDHLGKGIGRKLLEAIIQYCKDKEYKQMLAVITGSGADVPSILFHNSMGFEEIGVLKKVGFKQNTWLDTTYMQLALTDK